MARILAPGLERLVHVEHGDGVCALTVSVGDAVHARVAPADNDHALARSTNLRPRSGASCRTSVLRCDPAVRLDQEVHGEFDTREPTPGSIQVAGDPRADRYDKSVAPLPELGDRNVASDVDVVNELDSLLRQNLDAAIDDPLLELGVRHSESHQAPRALVSFVDGDLVTAVVELGCRGPAGPEPITATVFPVRRSGTSGTTQPSSNARSAIANSICSIVTGSSLIASTHADSHGAGQMRPVNSGKLFVACSWSIASRHLPRYTRSFHSGIRLPSGQPSWQNGTPQSMHRAPCRRSSASGCNPKYWL